MEHLNNLSLTFFIVAHLLYLFNLCYIRKRHDFNMFATNHTSMTWAHDRFNILLKTFEKPPDICISLLSSFAVISVNCELKTERCHHSAKGRFIYSRFNYKVDFTVIFFVWTWKKTYHCRQSKKLVLLKSSIFLSGMNSIKNIHNVCLVKSIHFVNFK
jgi:hypothetical protein